MVLVPNNFDPGEANIIGLGKEGNKRDKAKSYPCSLIEGQVLIATSQECNNEFFSTGINPDLYDFAFCAEGNLDTCYVS